MWNTVIICFKSKAKCYEEKNAYADYAILQICEHLEHDCVKKMIDSLEIQSFHQIRRPSNIVHYVQHQDVSVHVFLTHSVSIKCPHAVNQNK